MTPEVPGAEVRSGAARRLLVHAHFHQPPREDPFSGEIPPDRDAAPFRDWNARIAAECYRPLAELDVYRRISFDVGGPLAGWLGTHDPTTAGAMAAGVGAIAIPYHHAILPLASPADARTEVRWGLRAFEARFGRRARAAWLPEAAVDLASLRLLADEGVEATILAPWQVEAPGIDLRRPVRIDLGDGRAIVVVRYDERLSVSLSFDPNASVDADRFVRERVLPRLTGADGWVVPAAGSSSGSGSGDHPQPSDDEAGLVVIATDGELYGHHQPFRDRFLARLVAADGPADGLFAAGLAEALDDLPGLHPTGHLNERTSWSCHHGVARWGWECPDAPDGRWKAPLRAAFDRLAAGVDAIVDERFRAAGLDLAELRDGWIEVVEGLEAVEPWLERRLAAGAAGAARDERVTVAAAASLMDAVRWRLAMYASDAWFWDDPVRTETRGALRRAARAARLVDAATGSRLEAALRDDLAAVVSPASGLDGRALYRMALAEVGQPA